MFVPVRVTWVTFADAAVASAEPAWDVIIDENCDPFCRRAIRCATGVLALKNFAQLTSIACVAPVPPAGSDDELAEDVGEAEGLAVLAGLLVDVELLHPVSAMPTVSSSAADVYPTSRKGKGCIPTFCRRTGRVKS